MSREADSPHASRRWLADRLALGVIASFPATTHATTDDYCGGSSTKLAESSNPLGFFTNNGMYMPRVECMQSASGSPDWPWIVALILLSAGVIAWYLRIYIFWLRSAYREQARDRDPKLLQLANIFLWCSICGYGMSILMFFWPAYRLLAVFLFVLNVWSWSFVMTIDRFGAALKGRRYERELHESIAKRNEELELIVAERTRELEVARNAADAANQAKSYFLARMSHEIRTPMAAILGYADLLGQARSTADEAPSHDQCVTTIKRNGEHLLTIINDILDLSRIEADRMTVERLPTDPRQIIQDAAELFGMKASERGIGFAVEYENELPATIESDPVRLRQILFNLIANAIKFTESGSVRVIAALDDQREPAAVRISVIDTGIGMTPQQTRTLFQPFAQADPSIARRYGGTGLGLRISQSLAKLLGGSIEVESKPGCGSTFTLRIPAKPASGQRFEAERHASAARASRPLEGKRIFFAEDSPDNQRLIAHHLRSAGALVTVFNNGKECLDALVDSGATQTTLLRPAPCDLILTDMDMPEMDGYTMARALRSLGWSGPIIALTAYAMDDDRQSCFRAGCDGHISKPIAVERLIEACVHPAARRAA